MDARARLCASAVARVQRQQRSSGARPREHRLASTSRSPVALLTRPRQLLGRQLVATAPAPPLRRLPRARRVARADRRASRTASAVGAAEWSVYTRHVIPTPRSSHWPLGSFSHCAGLSGPLITAIPGLDRDAARDLLPARSARVVTNPAGRLRLSADSSRHRHAHVWPGRSFQRGLSDAWRRRVTASIWRDGMRQPRSVPPSRVPCRRLVTSMRRGRSQARTLQPRASLLDDVGIVFVDHRLPPTAIIAWYSRHLCGGTRYNPGMKRRRSDCTSGAAPAPREAVRMTHPIVARTCREYRATSTRACQRSRSAARLLDLHRALSAPSASSGRFCRPADRGRREWRSLVSTPAHRPRRLANEKGLRFEGAGAWLTARSMRPVSGSRSLSAAKRVTVTLDTAGCIRRGGARECLQRWQRFPAPERQLWGTSGQQRDRSITRLADA